MVTLEMKQSDGRTAHDLSERLSSVKQSTMEDRKELIRYLTDIIGEEGCAGSCDDTRIFKDEEGWKLHLCGFM